MPLTRFEECWPLPTESLSELPQNHNIVTLSLTLWPITCGVLTSLLLPHLSSSLIDSLPSLNLLCHLETDVRFMQDGPKAVWSIAYISVAFFPSLKQYLIAYRSSKVSSGLDCIFEIHQLWQSGFSRVYSDSCCRCPFDPETIRIGQWSHRMYSNYILNFQESTTILNACTKMSGTILNARRIYIYIYIYVCVCVCVCVCVRVCVCPRKCMFVCVHKTWKLSFFLEDQIYMYIYIYETAHLLM